MFYNIEKINFLLRCRATTFGTITNLETKKRIVMADILKPWIVCLLLLAIPAALKAQNGVLGPDTTICAGSCILLDAGPGSGYTWISDGAALIPSQQQVLICPGANISYVAVSYTDASSNSATDTIGVTVTPVVTGITPDTIIALGNCITLSADSVTFNTFTWTDITMGGNFSGSAVLVCPTTTTQYQLDVTSANGCAGTDTVTITIDSTIPPAGLVWPGDANNDGLADNNDILPIGLIFGDTGPVRPGASTTWVGQVANDWGALFSNGIDHKYADCDGNGVVDSQDVSVILLNYGLTHPKDQLPHKSPNGDLLYIDLLQDTVPAGDTAVFIVKLGTSSLPAQNAYGLAFSVNYNQTLVQSGSFEVDYSNSWLGDLGLDMVKLDIELPTAGMLDIGITRTDRVTRTGFDEICRVSVVTIDNISGKDLVYENLPFWISDVVAIDNNGHLLDINTVGDTLTLTGQETGIISVEKPLAVSMYPNPANAALSIHSAEVIDHVIIYNYLGQEVQTEMVNGSKHTVINTESLSQGTYFVEVHSGYRSAKNRLMIVR